MIGVTILALHLLVILVVIRASVHIILVLVGRDEIIVVFNFVAAGLIFVVIVLGLVVTVRVIIPSFLAPR